MSYSSTDTLRSPLFRQVATFLFVGGLCYLLSISLMVFLVEWWSVEVNLANLIASIVAIYAAYILNGRFVFQRGRHAPTKELSLFFILSVIGLLINVILMYLMTEFLPIHYVISKTVVTVIVAAFNFLTRKFLVFSH